VLEIFPCKNIDASIQLPGSKYIANRVLPLCAMASGPSVLSNIVDNDDIQAAIAGLRALGYCLELDGNTLIIQPRTKRLGKGVAIDTFHSGTFSRFVTAIAATENCPITINCSDKMATRPMKELFESLRTLGVNIDSPNNKLPAIINGPITSNHCQLDAGRSSQFLSALLMVGGLQDDGLKIELVGEQVSNSYVEMTLHWMERMGVSVERSNRAGTPIITIQGAQKYQGLETVIPGDAVSASYFMGLVGIAGGRVKIGAFDFDSLQGESKFYQVLEKMGMSFEKSESDLVAIGDGNLKAVDVDMSEMPDVVQTLAVMASFAEGTTLIRNVAHLAYKESNRIEDTATELIKAGIEVKYGDDFLQITGGKPVATEIETYDDHRMAMSMALLGINTPGIRIKKHLVVNKSFPNYWSMMASCGLQSKVCQI
jgi:3-phosphoshikimate 1-carboxyvinyltransferase